MFYKMPHFGMPKEGYERLEGTDSQEQYSNMDSEDIEVQQSIIEPEVETKNKAEKINVCTLFFFILSLAILIAGIVVLIILIVVVGGQSPRVDLPCGPVEGIYDMKNDDFSFLGIRYAVSPEGDNRWKPPQGISPERGTCWRGIYKATDYGNQCVQTATMRNNSKVSGEEDCLFLDVYTQSLDPESKLPVVVYIHGGSLVSGNSHNEYSAPTASMAKDDKIVYVSIQYRLSVFGFLTLELFQGEQNGNYGLLDQIEALKWVKTNIAQFGGDPNSIALYGHSSGASSALALSVSPLVKGLVNRVWLSSGSTLMNQTKSEAWKRNGEILDATGCPTECRDATAFDACVKQCLIDKPMHDLAQAAFPTWNMDFMYDIPNASEIHTPLITIGDDVLPMSPQEIWQQNTSAFSDIPMMISFTAQETDNYPVYANEKKLLDWNNYTYTVNIEKILGSHNIANLTSEALRFYPFHDNAELPYTSMGTDIRVTCQTLDTILLARNALQSPVYSYIVKYRPSSPLALTGFPSQYSYHSLDTFAFFEAFDDVLQSSLSSSDKSFQNLIRSFMVKFLQTGDPSSSLIWPADQTGLVSNLIAFIDTDMYKPDHCRLWKDVDFLQYSWIN